MWSLLPPLEKANSPSDPKGLPAWKPHDIKTRKINPTNFDTMRTPTTSTHPENFLQRLFRPSRDPFSISAPRGGLWPGVLPLLILAAVIVAEFVTPTIRITPSLLTIALAILALFLKPRAILVWSLVLLVPVIYSLIMIPTAGVIESPLVIILRCLAFVVVAGMAYALAVTKDHARKQVEDLVSLLDALHTPVLVSSVDGKIAYANRPCHALLEQDLEMAKDPDFFTLFAHEKGAQALREEYWERFDGRRADQPLPLDARVSARKKPILALCSLLTVDGSPYLVSQLTVV